jgi:hypothetical protein
MIDHIGLTQVLILVFLVGALYMVRRTFGKAHPLLVLELTELCLAAVFFMVGGAKLVGRHDMMVLFQEIGVGQWLRYLTGALEVTGAALLIVPMLSGGSALMLGAIMVVATLIELFVLHRPPVAALVCLSGHTFVVWARTSQPRQPWIRLSRPRRASAGNKRRPVLVLAGEPLALTNHRGESTHDKAHGPGRRPV